MRGRLAYSLAISLIASCFAISNQSHVLAAEPNSIYFNEILWSGSSLSTADEFVELINLSDKVIDISGYSIFDLVNSKKMVQIDQGQIAPNGKYLIANYALSAENTILNIEPDLVENDISLSNEKFQIGLADRSGSIVDIAGDGQKPFYHKEITVLENSDGIKYKASIERSLFIDGAQINNWQISSSQKNLKKTKDLATPEKSSRPKIKNFKALNTGYAIGNPLQFNFMYEIDQGDEHLAFIEVSFGDMPDLIIAPEITSIVLPPQNKCSDINLKFSSDEGLSSLINISLNCYLPNPDLRFSEILTSPSEHDWDGDGLANSKDEWIEIYNGSPDQYVLDGWRIADASGKSFELRGQIDPLGYLVYYARDTGLSLNNNGEDLFLYDPQDNLNDQVAVPVLSANLSFALFSDWEKTDQPSPGLKNIHSKVLTQQKPSLPTPVADAIIKHESTKEAEPEPEEILGEEANTIYEERVITYKTSVALSSASKIEVPRLDGSMVLSAQSNRSSEAFNFSPLLIYLLAVILIIFITIIYLAYEFYRLE